jgi:hypothetical protein
MRKISFKPASRRSSHTSPNQTALQAPLRVTEPTVSRKASAQVTRVFGTHNMTPGAGPGHGIDGYIDLVHPGGGLALSQTLLVQSKASNRPFPSETDESFRYRRSCPVAARLTFAGFVCLVQEDAERGSGAYREPRVPWS